MGYPNKFIEKVVDEARDLLAQKYAHAHAIKAINEALDKHGFQGAQDRDKVYKLVKRKLDYRLANKKKSNQKRRGIAEKNLSFVFPIMPSSR